MSTAEKKDDGGVKRMNKWPLLACLAIVILMTIPEYSVARHDQGARVSENPDPGTTDVKDPAVALLDGVMAYAYVRDSYTPNGGENYRLMLKVSTDYANCDWSQKQPLWINSGYTRDQRRPDVTIVKMCQDFDPLTEEYVVFITWQEMNEDGHWEVWISNVTVIFSGTGLLTQYSYQGPVKISDPDDERFDAINPRINGSYVPPYVVGGVYYCSSSIVTIVYQQEYELDQYAIYNSYMAYDYNSLPWNPYICPWTTPLPVDNMGQSDGYNFAHPSLDIYMKKNTQGNGVTMSVIVVCDEQYDANLWGCVAKEGLFSFNPDDAGVYDWYVEDYYFNQNTNSPGYPDVALNKASSTIPVVVWQGNSAYAKHLYYPTIVNLGPCKTPSMRGISIDDSPRQYYYIDNDDNPTKVIREEWFNPGGFEVVWRSNTEQPGGGTYGIDSRNLEYKNNVLRLTHDYDNQGLDDAYSGSYNMKSIYHETTYSSDTYLTIATDNSGRGVVSFLRSNDEAWVFRWVDYAD